MAVKNSTGSPPERKITELIMPRKCVRLKSLYCFSMTTARANCSGETSRLTTDSLELSNSRMTARMSLGGSCSSTTISAWSPSASASSTNARSAPEISPAAIRLWVLEIRARCWLMVGFLVGCGARGFSLCGQNLARPSSHCPLLRRRGLLALPRTRRPRPPGLRYRQRLSGPVCGETGIPWRRPAP